MTAAQGLYVRYEMIVSAIINAILSIAFTLIVFGRQPMVAVSGSGGLIIDAVPQTLMIALMSVLVPTLLTRRRIAAGRVAALPGQARWPHNLILRSVLVAAVAAVVAWVLHATLMPSTGPTWRLPPTLLFKATYGAILGAVIARFAVVSALSD